MQISSKDFLTDSNPFSEINSLGHCEPCTQGEAI